MSLFNRSIHDTNRQVAAMIDDPTGTLAAGPVEIVDRPVGLIIAMAICIAATWFAPEQWIKLVVLRYLLTAVMLLIPFAVILWKRRLKFEKDGLEFAFGRRSVFIPWAAFDLTRKAGFDGYWNTLTLPVQEFAVAGIEHRKNGVAVAHGPASRFYFLDVSAKGTVAITPPIGSGRQPAGLIMHVARSMQTIAHTSTVMVTGQLLARAKTESLISPGVHDRR
jgi:hypothetical protein